MVTKFTANTLHTFTVHL